MLSTGMASAVVELFIAYAEWFFPGGKSAWVTPFESIHPLWKICPNVFHRGCGNFMNWFTS